MSKIGLADNGNSPAGNHEVTAGEVKRVLDLGRLLRSVLTPEELLELEDITKRTASPNLQQMGIEK